MNLVETHAHLYSDQFAEDRDDMINRLLLAGVQKVVLPNVRSNTIEGMLTLEAKYPSVMYPTIGLHPCEVKDNFEEELATVKHWLEKRSFTAVGEIGLDYFWDKTHISQQKEALHIQLQWALDYDIPVIIHCRDSFSDAADIIEPYTKKGLQGVYHCFTGPLEDAERAIGMGFYLGIGGVVTYKNGGLDKVLTADMLPQLVLETDSPYLAPVPYRGKRNETAYLPVIANKLAETLGISSEEVAEATTKNAYKLFRLE
jgi:TatD DNase family protein